MKETILIWDRNDWNKHLVVLDMLFYVFDLWWVCALKKIPVCLEQIIVPHMEPLIHLLIKLVLDLTLLTSVSVLCKLLHVGPLAASHGSV